MNQLKEKKRVIKHASKLKDNEILLYNNVEYEKNHGEILLFFDDRLVDRLNIQELLDIAIPDTYEFYESKKDEKD